MLSEKAVFDFGMRLRRLREDRGLSRAVFAKRLGVSRETVYRYENNIQDPSLERAKEIALILHTSLDYLTGLESSYTVKIPGISEEQRQALNEFLRVFVKTEENG